MCGTASSVHLRKQRALAVVGPSGRQ
jgi:hypothetical protein